jgi:hypothetical protein
MHLYDIPDTLRQVILLIDDKKKDSGIKSYQAADRE